MADLSGKQEHFARLVAEGSSQADAYRVAFNSKAKAESGYYIYALTDPRDSKIFYVGKGKGDRVSHHAKIARFDHGGNEGKNSLIIEIQNSGRKVRENILCYFGEDEQAALDSEKELITAFKAHGLTNISGGSSARGSKPVKEAKALLKQLAPVWWIKKHTHPEWLDAIITVFGSVEDYHACMKRNLNEVITGSGR